MIIFILLLFLSCNLQVTQQNIGRTAVRQILKERERGKKMAKKKKNLPSLLEGMKDKSSETMAATSRMMRVTSCSASHTNRQKVFGGLGGIVLEPNVSRRCSMSFGEPDNPVISIIHTHTHTRGKTKTKKSYLASIAVIYTGRENMNNPIPRPACTQQGDGPDWAHPLD